MGLVFVSLVVATLLCKPCTAAYLQKPSNTLSNVAFAWGSVPLLHDDASSEASRVIYQVSRVCLILTLTWLLFSLLSHIRPLFQYKTHAACKHNRSRVIVLSCQLSWHAGHRQHIFAGTSIEVTCRLQRSRCGFPSFNGLCWAYGVVHAYACCLQRLCWSAISLCVCLSGFNTYLQGRQRRL